MNRYLSLLFALFLVFLNFSNCQDTESIPKFELEGKWKEVKGNSIFDKARREAIYDIQRLGDVYTGKIISLDNALEHLDQIRTCHTCSEESESLLGLSLLRGLKRKENGVYYGEFYDLYNRKWFEVKVTPISQTQINIRTYAIFPIFGRNILWERGDDYYQKILKLTPESIQENKRYYALEVGSVDYIEEQFVYLLNLHKMNINPNTPIYFFSRQGKMLTKGSVLKSDISEIIVQIIEPKDLKQSLPVIFFDRTYDWSGKD